MNARNCLLSFLAFLLIGSVALIARAQDGDLVPITPENADQVTALAVLGRGWINDITWSPDGAWLAVTGSAGVWLHDAADFDAEPRLIAGHDGASPSART
jgi:hypothetical protein